MKQYLLVSLAITLLLGCGQGQEDRFSLSKDSSGGAPLACDVKFATFNIPKGWQANRSDKNTYVILSRLNESYPNITQMISIDIGKPVTLTAKASADAFAAKWSGRVEEASLNVDGESGLRVTIPPDKKTVRPIDCVITMHGERVFMLIGGAKDNGEIHTAIDEIVASWIWKK
jgi:hypothetical protein